MRLATTKINQAYGIKNMRGMLNKEMQNDTSGNLSAGLVEITKD
jgi:hypothetical protein